MTSASVIDARAEGRTVVSMFLETLAAKPDQIALRWRTGDAWGALTWAEVADRAAHVAGGLAAAGVDSGDRVLLMMRNRPEFHVADLGALLAGATPISIYNSSSAEQIAYLAGHAKARVAIVEDEGFLARIQQARAQLPALEQVFLIDGEAGGDIRPWHELFATGPVGLDSGSARNHPDGLATVIYTSGTTGPPKGVQITHRNVVWTVESYRHLVGDIEDLRTVSYLPMAHIAERVSSHYLALACGFDVATCPDASQLGAYCREVRPETIFGVPRVWEKMHASVRAGLAADPAKAAGFEQALGVALPLQLARRTRELTADEQATLDGLDGAVFRAVRERLGLDAARFAVSGAAPISVEVLEWFVAIGVPFSEIYGMSENTGPLTWEPWRIRPGTVGRAMPGVDVRLADDGEVVASGGLVFPGYLDDPAKTAEALDVEGWLHTGDIGVLDDDGYLRIVDRKKELIITAGGKNISPANLESALRTIPLVGQAAAIGDQRRFIAALLVLDPDGARAWAANHGKDDASLAELAADPELIAEVAKGVEEAMADFNHAEQVKRFTVLAEEWLPDSEELTPTSKLKRRGIHAKYAAQIEAMYE
ncbi:MAG: Long-chain-fatty-acid--CoA ligase [Acidimicrobiales bacterium]|nr:Long-chain-fatty-acid--CoA ligase [Acidimicrobiales bacterium]